MKAKKKAAAGAQGDLLNPGKARVVVTAAPGSLDYQPESDNAHWHCERFEALAAEVFSIAPSGAPNWKRMMEGFHSTMVELTRQWLILRRLFGIWLLVPGEGTTAADMRAHSREELCAELGIKGPALQEELDGIRLIFSRIAVPDGRRVETFTPGDSDQGELAWDEGLAEQLNISEAIFKDNRAERNWFLGKARAWKSVFDDPVASELGVATLMVMLTARRTRALFYGSQPEDTRYAEIEKRHERNEERLQEMLEKLKKLCPWVEAAESRAGLLKSISALITGCQEYYASGDRKLIDGIRTATEIQVELRTSVQVPLPRYRAGQTMFQVSSIAGLWDPKWRPHFPPKQVALMDRVFKECVTSARADAGEVAPDLLGDGPENEYEPVYKKDRVLEIGE